MKVKVIKSEETKNAGTFCSTLETLVPTTVFGIDTMIPSKVLFFTTHQLPVDKEDTLTGFKIQTREDGLSLLVKA